MGGVSTEGFSGQTIGLLVLPAPKSDSFPSCWLKSSDLLFLVYIIIKGFTGSINGIVKTKKKYTTLLKTRPSLGFGLSVGKDLIMSTWVHKMHIK